MKRTRYSTLTICLAVVALAFPTGTVFGQEKSLAATLDVYVFPTEGQEATQQSKDEAECYDWAAKQTGADPFQLKKDAQQVDQQAAEGKQQVAESGQGAGAQGAVKGAAAGALIGEIASDDPGKGAAYGAAAGMIAGRRSRRRAQESATQNIDQQAATSQANIAEQETNFKKAFSACLEAKKYMVKY